MKSKITGIVLLLLFPLYCLSQTICIDYSPKLSASTVNKIQESESRFTRGTTDNKLLFAYVHLKPDTNINDLSSKYGVRLNVGYNNVYTAIIPINQVNNFA